MLVIAEKAFSALEIFCVQEVLTPPELHSSTLHEIRMAQYHALLVSRPLQCDRVRHTLAPYDRGLVVSLYLGYSLTQLVIERDRLRDRWECSSPTTLSRKH